MLTSLPSKAEQHEKGHRLRLKKLPSASKTAGKRRSPTLDWARERAEEKESAECAERKLPSLCASSGSSLSDSCAAPNGFTSRLHQKKDTKRRLLVVTGRHITPL